MCADKAKPDYIGGIEWPVTVEIGPGLEGAITNETMVGHVGGEKGTLLYRGIDVRELARKSTYEETAYLLLFGRLPKKTELNYFKSELKAHRRIPKEVLEAMSHLPREVHPMSALRTAVSLLGCLDLHSDDTTNVESETRVAVRLIAQLPVVAAAVGRLLEGKKHIPPDKFLDHSANFLYMLTGEKPDEEAARIMDMTLILHADHGMNASTFTAMVIHSSLSGLYSAVVGGIGSLKGPLHGGANERSLEELLKLESEEAAKEYVENAIAKKQKIMGFGHRVYRTWDPRAVILREYAEKLSKERGQEKLLAVAETVEKLVIEAYGKKGIYPNVDFYSGLVYKALGIPMRMFTPIFAVSRVAGWTARVIEYMPRNRIFRPRAKYVGQLDAPYVPIDERE